MIVAVDAADANADVVIVVDDGDLAEGVDVDKGKRIVSNKGKRNGGDDRPYIA